MLFRSSNGGVITTWSPLPAVWASLKDLTGFERVTGQAETAQLDTEFCIRWISGITTKHRVSYDGAVYDIVSAKRIGRKQWLVISCSRVGGNL